MSIDLWKTTRSPFYNGSNPKNQRIYHAVIVALALVLALSVTLVPDTAGRSAFRVCYIRQHIKLGVTQVHRVLLLLFVPFVVPVDGR